MTVEQQTVFFRKCERCGHEEMSKTPFAEDYPEGVYVTIRRVTANRTHYLTDEIFCCSKECAVELIQYGIHANATTFRPIAREGR